MYIFLYLIRGFTLIWYLISPSYREKTNARWRRMRPHRLVFEIGAGIIGVLVTIAFVLLLIKNVTG